MYHGLSIPDALATAVRERPDTEIIFHSALRPARLTIGELHERSRAVSGGLAELGVGEGDVVAVLMPNWSEWATVYPAILSLGAVLVPIIPIYGPAEIGFILAESEAKVLVVADRLGKMDFAEIVAATPGTDRLSAVVVVGEPWDGAVAWETVAAAAPAITAPRPAGERAVMVYTSGTSADPKGVQHSHETILADVASMREFFGPQSSVPLAAFPFAHIAGLLELTRAFLYADRTIVMDAWDPAAAAALVAEHAVTSTAGTPFHLIGLLDAAEADDRSLASINEYITGAAAVPPALVERAEAAGVPTVRCYGCSEHPTVSAGHPSDSVEHRTQTDGRAMPGTEIRILRDDDTDAAQGEGGEILVRGPEQFLGYKDPALNKDAYFEGWLRTGDVGHLDTEGYLTITDRKKDIIVRGGENISSREVEDALMALPAVVEAAVVAMPDEKYGERVCAFVSLRADVPGLTLEDLQAHFAARGMARQKTPERIELVTEFPRTPSGKIKKPVLREQLEVLVG